MSRSPGRLRRLAPSARRAVLALAALLVAGPVLAAIEVRLTLPQRAKLDLRGKDSVSVLPFLVVDQEGEGRGPERDIDVEREFHRYLEKILRRQTDLRVVEPGPIGIPPREFEELLADEAYWRDLGDRLQADLLVTGNLDFDIQDRSGYRTQEFTSPIDGRTYYRQVLVEQTGFEYDILLVVVDGATGRPVHRDNFKDFQSFQSDEVDPIAGMFENLYALEDRLLAVFTQNEVEASRILFTETR